MTADESNTGTDLKVALAEAHRQYASARPQSAALSVRAHEVMPGGNTRSVLAYRPFPTAMARGEGCRLWDIDGHAYLDLCGEYTAGLFGHSETRIHDAVRAALQGGLSLAAVGEAEEQLARRIRDRFSSIEKVRFTNSGTEANLMAITAARAVTKRAKVMVFRGGYHGAVLTFALGASPQVTVPFPFLVAEYNDTEGAATLIRDHGRDLAAVLVEPMLGAGGCIPGTAEFLSRLRSATQDTGSVLIFDEVMTSRTSAGGAQERLSITPDMTTLGKYLAGGLSFGAFGGRSEIMRLYETDLPHAGTFNNNVLSMAAGNVGLGKIFTAETADRLFRLGEALRSRLNTECARANIEMQFTGLGSLATPHFRLGRIDRPYAPSQNEHYLRELFFFDMLKSGIYLARRGMSALSLPVQENEVNHYVNAVQDFVRFRRQLMNRVAS